MRLTYEEGLKVAADIEGFRYSLAAAYGVTNADKQRFLPPFSRPLQALKQRKYLSFRIA